MTKLFGTDGIRGTANLDLTAELTLAVGRAVALACRDGALGGPATARPRIVVGRDTRPSGPLLEGALVAGACSAGADVLRAGVLPTPGVAFCVGDLGADAGIVLSASHNPPEDNGIKVFGPGGWKLPSAAEAAVAELVVPSPERELPRGGGVGRVIDVPAAVDRYVDHLAAAIRTSLGGMRVVVDYAHGAAVATGPRALERAGARVYALHDSDDGDRINVGCGATHPQEAAAVARREGIPALALDGDADRVVACDEDGSVVSGDAILALLAGGLRRRGALAGDAMVLTVMANQALRVWCEREGIRVVETPVGDRHVLEALRSEGLVLGGEQSGHVIRLDEATTGDGVLTGLGLLEVVASGGGRLRDIVPFRPFPQVLVNVRTGAAHQLDEADAVWNAVDVARRRLGADGRVLVRPSGTEPIVRVMVEAGTMQEAESVAASLASVVERELNGGM